MHQDTSPASHTGSQDDGKNLDAPAPASAAAVPRASDRALPTYTLAEVAEHARVDDCWIVVHDVVYDMTAHCLNHEGWTLGAKQSTLLAVLSAMGCDCTLDFDAAGHSRHAMAQLTAVRIGVLSPKNSDRQWIRYRSWDELIASGVVPADKR